MRKTNIVSLLFAASLAALVFTITAAGDGAVTYGSGLGDATVVSIGDLLASPGDYVGKTVRVEGRIDAVCPMRGCWLDIGDGKSSDTVRFKVRDGEIEFPTSAKGKNVVAEGVFTKMEMDHEQALAYAQHMAEEQGREFDPEKEDVSSVLYRIDGRGAVIE